MRLVYTTKVSSLKVLFLLAGPGLYAIQLMSRYAVSPMEWRQAIDIVYILFVTLYGLFNFKIASSGYTKLVGIFSIISVVCNLFSLLGTYGTLSHVLYSSISFIFFPAFLAIIARSRSTLAVINSFLYYFLLPLLFLNFSVAFIELYLRDVTTLASLQIVGRSYELIALCIAGLVMASRMPEVKTKLILWWYFISVIMSFSRGAVFVATLIFLKISTESAKRLLKWIGSILLSIFLIIWSGFSAEFINANFGNLLEFWEKRLNVGQDFSVSTNIAGMRSGRVTIYQQCLTGIADNPLFGTGLGQTQSYFIKNYPGLAFSGCHNLFITPFLERGVFGGLASVFVAIISGNAVLKFSLLKRETTPFFLFAMLILFATSTGAEFFIMSDSFRNANVLLSFFLIISFFGSNRREC